MNGFARARVVPLISHRMLSVINCSLVFLPGHLCRYQHTQPDIRAPADGPRYVFSTEASSLHRSNLSQPTRCLDFSFLSSYAPIFSCHFTSCWGTVRFSSHIHVHINLASVGSLTSFVNILAHSMCFLSIYRIATRIPTVMMIGPPHNLSFVSKPIVQVLALSRLSSSKRS